MKGLSICLLFFALNLSAQQRLAFEVASIKVFPPNQPIMAIGGAPSGTRLKLVAMSLADLVSGAYDVKPWQVSGGPQWAGTGEGRQLDPSTRRFDIEAKAEGDDPPSRAEFLKMLQGLLAERFHLIVHHMSREIPVYALVVDKNGPKFKASPPGTPSMMSMQENRITGTGATMQQLVNWFSEANGVDRPTIDATGLAGVYDFELESSLGLADSTLPSVFSAFQEQLGLKFEPRRAPIDFIVIDAAEMPGEN